MKLADSQSFRNIIISLMLSRTDAQLFRNGILSVMLFDVQLFRNVNEQLFATTSLCTDELDVFVLFSFGCPFLAGV